MEDPTETGAGLEEDNELEQEVPEALSGMRLDAAAAQLFSEHSRARLQAWIEDGRLLHNGAVAAKARQPVAAGDLLQLRVDVEDFEPGRVLPQPVPFEVLYEDSALAIVLKPAGLTVHPGAGQADGTLQNGLLHRFPQTAAVPRAGIVHRLDKDTSGVLVVALTPVAHTALVAALARREIRREYDALVHGAPVAGGTVDLPIGRHSRDRLRMAVTDRGRPAVTHYRVQERFGRYTLLRVRLETGRTHQIRVHMAQLRMPIVGDALYGGQRAGTSELSPALRARLGSFPRQALHARELELRHPISGERLAISAEPPEDMSSLLEALRAETQS